jgi:hypothetical protein
VLRRTGQPGSPQPREADDRTDQSGGHGCDGRIGEGAAALTATLSPKPAGLCLEDRAVKDASAAKKADRGGVGANW